MTDQTSISLDPLYPRQRRQAPQDNHQQASPDILPPSQTFSSAVKTYNLYYTTSRTNVKLHLGSFTGPCIYYGECHFLSTKPQLRLRSGDSKSAPMVAFARLHATLRRMQIGLGDLSKGPEHALVWEEMRREKFCLSLQRSDYEFATSVGGLGPRKTYGWRVENHMLRTLYTCVDEEGQVVASMRSGGMCNWRKGGEIDVAEGLEKKLEELLVMSALGIWVSEAGWSICSGYGGGRNGADDGLVDVNHQR